MSVMSAGKKPRALIHPLRAGNSQTRVRGGQFRPAEPGTRPPARKSSAFPACRCRRRAPRPGPAAGDQEFAGAPAALGGAGPARADWGSPAGTPAPGGTRRSIPSRPAVPAVAPAPGRPRPPGQTAAPSRARAPRPASAPSRVRAAGPASAPSRLPGGRVRRTRLTRRGRRLVWACAVLLHVAVLTPVLFALASGAQAANQGVPPSAVRAAMRHVVVKPGQTLWSIALNAAPEADPRVVVQQIMDFNALGSQVVVPGESLWVPRG